MIWLSFLNKLDLNKAILYSITFAVCPSIISRHEHQNRSITMIALKNINFHNVYASLNKLQLKDNDRQPDLPSSTTLWLLPLAYEHYYWADLYTWLGLLKQKSNGVGSMGSINKIITNPPTRFTFQTNASFARYTHVARHPCTSILFSLPVLARYPPGGGDLIETLRQMKTILSRRSIYRVKIMTFSSPPHSVHRLKDW